MPKDLIIVGAGSMGREVLQWIKDINKIEKRWNILGFINDDRAALDDYACGHSIIGTIEEWQPKKGQEFVCAIADPFGKEKVANKLKKRGAVFVSIIHPTAIISDHAELGEGLIVYPFSGVSVNTIIGDFVSILGTVGISHDVEIDDYCTITGYCELAGKVKLGKKVFLGSSVTVIPEKKIGTGAYVAAGSVVMTNIKAGYRVMGYPAKKMDF